MLIVLIIKLIQIKATVRSKLKPRRLITSNAGENLGQMKFSYISGCSVKQDKDTEALLGGLF